LGEKKKEKKKEKWSGGFFFPQGWTPLAGCAMLNFYGC
jgi:hypothetical protein